MSYMNRIGNCTNPYQTSAKRVLCVCSAGLLRSPTTANVLHKEYGYNTRACGSTPEYALIPLDDVLIKWADELVFVEQSVFDRAWSDHSDSLKHKKNVVLTVPDSFEWNDPHLIAEIKAQYEKQLTGVDNKSE